MGDEIGTLAIGWLCGIGMTRRLLRPLFIPFQFPLLSFRFVV